VSTAPPPQTSALFVEIVHEEKPGAAYTEVPAQIATRYRHEQTIRDHNPDDENKHTDRTHLLALA
jgi:hypothetical protein